MPKLTQSQKPPLKGYCPKCLIRAAWVGSRNGCCYWCTLGVKENTVHTATTAK